VTILSFGPQGFPVLAMVASMSLLQAPKPALPIQPAQTEAPAECVHCGMDRQAFARSRMLVVNKNGSRTGTCSLHCTAIELTKTGGSFVTSLLVGDHGNPAHPLTDARTAIWVIGGSERGVMTAVPKWAFAERRAADAFVQMHGGRLATFAEALAAATGELKE